MGIRSRLLPVVRALATRVLDFADGGEPATTGARPVTDEVSAEAHRGAPTDILQPRDEVLKNHANGDYAVYRKLLDDDQVRPCFKQLRSEVVAREWKVDPGGPDPIDKLAADDLQAQLEAISWDRTCFKMLYGVIPGFSVGEMMWGIDDATGLVRMHGVKVRLVERFRFTNDGSLRVMRNGKPEALPDQKFWVFKAGSEHDDDPYGTGEGAALYWPVWMKRHGLRFWSVFLEHFANPTPKATVPAGTTEDDRNKLLEMLDRIINGGKIIVPRGVDVELIQSMRSSGGDFDVFCQRMDAAIAKILLLQTMTTDNGSSLSQAQVHHRVSVTGAKTHSDLLDESFMAGPGRWLTRWNYPGAKTPKLYRNFEDPADLKALADRDQVLANIGYRPRAKYIIETYGDNYDYVPPAPPALGPAFAELGPPRHYNFPCRLPAFAEAPPDSASDLVSGGGWERIMAPEVERIEALLADCRTMVEFRERLGELATEDPEVLAQVLARMSFAARLAGNADAEATGDGRRNG